MKAMHKAANQHGQAATHEQGVCPQPTTPLSDEAVSSLLFMIEEEKLAGDIYEAFYDQTGMTVFSNIAASEDRHMDALLKQADLAGIDVSAILALPAGQFSDPSLQALYDDLYAAGSVSPEAALLVGQQIELADIADLNAAMADAADTSLIGVYSHLLDGSENHLAAFDNLLA